MKTRILALGGLAVLLGAGFPIGVSAQTGVPAPPAGKMQKREHHPELVAALKALHNAKTRLQKADRDFDGHRAKAEELTESAIREVEAAIASDKK